MKFATLNFQNNPHLGIFTFATDNFCLTNKEMREKDVILFQKVLKIPVYRISVLGTSLIGMFIGGNSKGVIISDRLQEEEIEEIKKYTKVFVIETKHTAIGNLILANDKGCIISKEIESFRKDIANFLGVETKIGTIASMELVGSLAVANSNGCLTTKWIKSKEKDLIEKTLEVKVSCGSVNFGSQWIRSGLVANSNGFLAGEETTGIELGIIAEALGFTKNK
jgi:translation initiation factor 6